MEAVFNQYDFLNFSLAASLVVKIGLIVFFLLYLFFAFLLIRELFLMSSSITTPLEKTLKRFAYFNFLLAFILFLVAVFWI